MWSRLSSLPVISLIAVSSACTYAVPPDANPLPPFESVAIVSEGATEELKARFGVTPDNSSVGKGVGAGAGAGALAAVGLSAACGPFFLVCALGALPAGMMVGGAGGALVGASVDAQQKPPEEQLLVLDKLFLDIAQQRTIHLEIRDALEQKIPSEWLEDASSADALLQLSLSDARFTQNASGEYALTLQAIMSAQWNRNMRRLRNGKRVYHAASRSLPLEDWLQDNGNILNLAFDACVEDLVEQMVEDIRFQDL